MISKKVLFLYQKLAGMALCHQPLYADPVYLFAVFLFYLFFCANVIAKLITKPKAMTIIQN